LVHASSSDDIQEEELPTTSKKKAQEEEKEIKFAGEKKRSRRSLLPSIQKMQQVF